MSQISIKAGQILHAMNQFVVDRIQTGGAGNLNIPQERIYELGNYQSVGIVRDIPDLSFSLDVLDVGTQVEGLICGSANPDADAMGTDGTTGTRYDLINAGTVDVISPFKSAQGQFNVVRGVAVPQLAIESVSYRYGMTSNAGETFTLRGDSIYYIPGSPYQAHYVGDGTTTAYLFSSGGATPVNLTALLYTESGVQMYALNVSVNGVRLTRGIDYTDDATGVTFNTAPANNANVRIVFGSTTASTYPQAVHGSPSALHVRPAAIRGKDILVFVGKQGGNPFRWGEVQSINVDWRVTLEADYEFGNAHAIARDYVNAPDLSGSVEIKPTTAASLFAKLNQITGVPSSDVVGPQSSVTLPLMIQLRNPDTGAAGQDVASPTLTKGQVLKTLYIPDCRFTIPGYEGRASQKLVNTLNWESDTGVLQVFKGLPYGV